MLRTVSERGRIATWLCRVMASVGRAGCIISGTLSVSVPYLWHYARKRVLEGKDAGSLWVGDVDGSAALREGLRVCRAGPVGSGVREDGGTKRHAPRPILHSFKRALIREFSGGRVH